jgi:hypothetical protein
MTAEVTNKKNTVWSELNHKISWDNTDRVVYLVKILRRKLHSTFMTRILNPIFLSVELLKVTWREG